MTTLAPPSTTRPAAHLLPVPPLRGHALSAAGLGCLAAAGLAVTVHTSLNTAPAQPLVAVAGFAAMMTIALVAMRDHHPFPRFGPANHVTMLRGMLAATTASVMIEPAQSTIAWPLVVTTLTMVTLDGVDGWFARRTRMSSAFGARFDMEIDAFFMLVLSILVWRYAKAGPWVIAIGLMRYAFVAAGWVMPWLARPLRATSRGKAVAIVQFAALGAALAPVVPGLASTVVCAAALAALVWSFTIDVRFLYEERARPDGRAL
jgi:phosphatidylglycerophosphate synthase